MRKPLIVGAVLILVLIILRIAVVRRQARELHLDHVPIAVRELPAAAAELRDLGFTIKPGRPHENGIENASVKFADGSYVELITAHDATDAVTKEYSDFLKLQEGAAYVFLRDADGRPFSQRVIHEGGRREQSGPFAFTKLPASWGAPRLQLIEYLTASADTAEDYRHSNGARRLLAVWLLIDNPDVAVVRELGARPAERYDFAFDNREARAVGLAGGAVLMLVPRAAQDPARSTSLAILVEVDSLALVKQGKTATQFVSHGPALWLPPSVMHGVWLGFIERARWAAQ